MDLTWVEAAVPAALILCGQILNFIQSASNGREVKKGNDLTERGNQKADALHDLVNSQQDKLVATTMAAGLLQGRSDQTKETEEKAVMDAVQLKAIVAAVLEELRKEGS